MNYKGNPFGRIVMIHGIRGENPEKHIGRLAPEFRRQGFSVIIPNYGSFNLFSLFVSAYVDTKVSSAILPFLQEDDILLGHSNGATLVYMLTQKIRVRGAILVNAALDADKLPNADFIHIYFNHGDMVSSLSALMPFTPWGAMGSVGYTGPVNHTVMNIDCGDPPYDLPQLDGHSALFEAGNTAPWARFMSALAIAEINHTYGSDRILQ